MPPKAGRGDKPDREALAAPEVRYFRQALNAQLTQPDEKGRKWGSAKWGCYAFYDYDGEPIYVGQTNERLSARIRRHLTNQRTDAVAMRILDVFEVAELEVWPLWEYQDVTSGSVDYKTAQQHLDALEFAVYEQAVKRSRYKAILNEVIPPRPEPGDEVELPSSSRFKLIDPVEAPVAYEARSHDDVRIARRAETLSRLAAVAHERGVVSPGLRRVLAIQAIRLTYLTGARLAKFEGRDLPRREDLNSEAFVGNVWRTDSEPDASDG